MAKVTEITVWTRGVVMDKEARDVANAFAQAAKLEGKFVQAFDNYEDLPTVCSLQPGNTRGSVTKRSR